MNSDKKKKDFYEMKQIINFIDLKRSLINEFLVKGSFYFSFLWTGVGIHRKSGTIQIAVREPLLEKYFDYEFNSDQIDDDLIKDLHNKTNKDLKVDSSSFTALIDNSTYTGFKIQTFLDKVLYNYLGLPLVRSIKFDNELDNVFTHFNVGVSWTFGPISRVTFKQYESWTGFSSGANVNARHISLKLGIKNHSVSKLVLTKNMNQWFEDSYKDFLKTFIR